jgi:hypothetical protein
MASLSSTATVVANKSPTHSIPLNPPALVDGLVQHALVSPMVQVQILSVVDATGTATISDIIAELPGHEDPVGAIFALVAAGVLEILSAGIIDANSIAARNRQDGGLRDPAGIASDGNTGPQDPLTDGVCARSDDADARLVDPASGNIGAAHPCTMNSAAVLPAGLQVLQATPLRPRIIVGDGKQRSSFRRVPGLDQPGVYILLHDGDAYVGYGADVGARIAGGRQMGNDRPDHIIAITDLSNGLSVDDAQSFERMLWSYVAADNDYKPINEVPDGAPITPERYGQLSLFAAEIVLALRQAGLMFLHGSTRERMAGPRTEPARLGTPRRIDDLPKGRVRELDYCGLTAMAAEREDGSWLLLRGSDVRVETVTSANASVSFLRAAWLHAGLIELAQDSSCYVVKRDLVFGSGSAVGHFVSGSKGFGVSAWRPLDESDAGLPMPAA